MSLPSNDKQGVLNADAPRPNVAVVIPCFNEGGTIASVVWNYMRTLPEAEIHIFDNASTDGTATAAEEAGAIVHSVPIKGKGNVVQAMFADVDADIYVMVDGDNTYDPQAARPAIDRLWEERLDLVNIARIPADTHAERLGHQFGNRLFQKIITGLFRRAPGDMLSGYKVLSRRFVKSFTPSSAGFEIETELMIHAFEMRVAWQEIRAGYHSRPKGSSSKLRTFRDGWRILSFIVKLYKHEHPLAFFTIIAALFVAISLALGIPVIAHYIATGLVPRLPTAVLAASLMLLGAMSVVIGLILDTVSYGRREQKRLTYLSYPAPGCSTRVR